MLLMKIPALSLKEETTKQLPPFTFLYARNMLE